MYKRHIIGKFGEEVAERFLKQKGYKINSEQELKDTLNRIKESGFQDLFLIQEYIEGDVISDLIKEKHSIKEYIPQLKEMAKLAKEKGLNIDYYPTNFVVKNKLLYYIDYECNSYTDEWNLDNWGMKYWNGEKEL